MTEQILKGKLYFKDKDFKLYLGDCISIMKEISDGAFDMIFADPPYFLSNGGITCNNGQMVSVDKAEWDKNKNIQEVHEFNLLWLTECKRILKPNGTIWISGTFHNIYSIGLTLQQLNYKILNNVTWFKRNAPPNLSCRYFTHSTETILWAKKSTKAKHHFNYELMKEINGGKQMRDVWEIPAINKKEKKHGSFPTQKPLSLLERIVLATTEVGDCILDPFNGSGTTGIASYKLDRNYVGIDNVEEYLDLTIRRYNEIKEY